MIVLVTTFAPVGGVRVVYRVRDMCSPSRPDIIVRLYDVVIMIHVFQHAGVSRHFGHIRYETRDSRGDTAVKSII